MPGLPANLVQELKVGTVPMCFIGEYYEGARAGLLVPPIENIYNGLLLQFIPCELVYTQYPYTRYLSILNHPKSGDFVQFAIGTFVKKH